MARIQHTDSQLTQMGDFLGSPAYMSPEQVKDPRKIDGRADIYSLGATLYHLLTGRPPFQAASLSQTLEHVKHLTPVAPRELNPEIEVDLETICMKCLEKDPNRRYPNAERLADDLQRFLNEEPIHARPPTPIDRFMRWYPKHASTMLGAYFIVTPFTWLLYIFGSRFVDYGTGLHMSSVALLPWPIAWIFVGYHLIKQGGVFEVINTVFMLAFAILPVFLNRDPQQLVLIVGIISLGVVLQLGAFWTRLRTRRSRQASNEIEPLLSSYPDA
ncbi:MAG: protein kinase [Pirellulaceae bacterium]